MPMVLKSKSLNLLEPSGPVQACNRFALILDISGRNVEEIFNVLIKLPFFCTVVPQSNTGLGGLIVNISRSVTIRQILQVGLLSTSDQLVSEAATYKTHNKHIK
jgi:hypothetical protein